MSRNEAGGTTAARGKPPGWRRSGRAALPLLGGLVLLALAGLYVRSRHTATSRGLTLDDLAQKLEKLGHQAGAREMRLRCEQDEGCACRQRAARAALDADLHAEALAVLSRDVACNEQPESLGLRAEALARAGQSEQARALAGQARNAVGKNAFASYALAQVAYASGDRATARQSAQLAVELGRGGPAHLLLGVMAYREGALDLAKSEFQKMLLLDPDDVDASYNLALLAQGQKHYRDAREGYLHVLRRAPGYASARYNLVLLTSSVGALDEARHHLREFEKIVEPGDPRLGQLETVVAQAAARGSANAVAPAAPTVSAPLPSPVTSAANASRARDQ